ncbi:MAG: folate-binding protein [Pseudomonadota bacterium]
MSLDELGLIRTIGPEARSFLQSQLTNDAKPLCPTQGQLSGYCSPKGRLLAVFTVLELGEDDFALALPAALVAPTLKRLRMFVLRSKLTLSDASAELPALGVIGAQIAEALSAQGFVLPASDYGVAQHDGIWLLRRPGPVPRFELRAAPERLAALQQNLNLPPAGTDDWALAEVLAGIPQVTAETSDHFVPQTIDLDAAGGVSFTKGCYPGQEIVARVHYLGRVKQRLHLAHCAAGALPGTPIFQTDGSGQPVGELMAAAPAGHQGFMLSMALHLDHSASTTLRLGAVDGPVIGLPQKAH